MSLPDRRPQGRAAARAVALLSSLALAGCIQPLYGSLGTNPDLAGDLQAISVDPIAGRLGHYLGNELIFALNGTGAQVAPKYRLSVTVTESVQTSLLDTVSGYPTAANVVVSADYRLVRAAGGEPVANGNVTAFASYDRTSQRFANIRAAADSQIRGAKTLAEQIRTRIAAALATRG